MDWLSRTRLLVGEEGLRRLQGSRVAVFGLGGVGGAAAWALGRSGIGGLTLVDLDLVSASNLNRQMVALADNLGVSKVQAAAQMLRAFNPSVELSLRCERACEENIPSLVAGADFVADCIDDVPAKCALIAHCTREGIPIVSSMGAGNRLDPSAFRVMDLYETCFDGLARALRGRLRKLGVRSLPVVCSLEPPLRAGVQEEGRRSPGSIAFVPPAAGLVLAGEICRRIVAGSGEDPAATNPGKGG